MNRKEFTAFFFTKLLVLVNVIFTFVGLGIMVAGIVLVIKAQDLEQEVELLQELPLKDTAYGVIFVGVTLMVLAIAGAWSSPKIMLSMESNLSEDQEKTLAIARTVQTAYMFSLFVLLTVQITLSVYLFEYHSAEVLDDVVENQWFAEGIVAREKRVQYQDFFECCGWDNIYDSRAAGYDTPCSISRPSTCKNATLDYFARFFTPAAIAIFVFASLQVVAFLASVYVLCCMPKDEEEEEDWL